MGWLVFDAGRSWVSWESMGTVCIGLHGSLTWGGTSMGIVGECEDITCVYIGWHGS